MTKLSKQLETPMFPVGGAISHSFALEPAVDESQGPEGCASAFQYLHFKCSGTFSNPDRIR